MDGRVILVVFQAFTVSAVSNGTMSEVLDNSIALEG